MKSIGFVVFTVGLVLAGLFYAAAPARAQDAGCSLAGCGCGADALQPVVVTDWETNRQQQFGCLSCAVQAMVQRHPWSQAVVCEPEGIDRVSLTRVGQKWSVSPPGAVVALRPGWLQDCSSVSVFADEKALNRYQARHSEWKGVVLVPLADFPAHVKAAQAQPVERFEAARAVDQVLGGTPAALPAPAPDVPADHWAAPAVARAMAEGIIEGYPDGTFQGSRPVSRYELALIVARLLQRMDNQPPEGSK